MDLLPGLPYDVALECLIRLPFDNLSSATSVSKAWKAEIELPGYRRHREAAGFSQPLVVVAQAWVDPTRKPSTSKVLAPLFYRLAVCVPETGAWSDLPPLPDFLHGMPILCHLVGVGSELVVMGGCDPVDWRVVDSVFVYNFVSNTWRRGTPMPGGHRFFFGCASDNYNTVYIAGGHDENKNALKTAMAYDVAKDEWARLPDMAMARDECKGVFHRGKFHVISGYSTESQGHFSNSAEVFDLATWRWDSVEDEFLEDVTCPRTFVIGDDHRVYKCCKDHLVVREGATWKVVIGLPAEVRNVDCVTAWHGKLLVIGSTKFGEAHVGYVVDLKDYTWKKVEAPAEYSGHVQSCCYLEI